jgi:hypothetical protein
MKTGEKNMPDTPELTLQLPLFDEAAQSIKESGSYDRELTAQELAEIMSVVVSGLTQGQESVSVSMQKMGVRIENSRGRVNGSVKVEKPIKAMIKVMCVLENDVSPDRIQLAELEIHQEAGFTARLAMKAVNIEGKAREVLRDPNDALRLALASQLERRGVRLTGLGTHFTESALAVSLRGEPAAT